MRFEWICKEVVPAMPIDIDKQIDTVDIDFEFEGKELFANLHETNEWEPFLRGEKPITISIMENDVFRIKEICLKDIDSFYCVSYMEAKEYVLNNLEYEENIKDIAIEGIDYMVINN